MQHQRYVLLAFVATAVLLGWAVQAAAVSGFEAFGVLDTRYGGVIHLSTLLALASGVATFVGLIRNKRAVSFTDEVIDELLKVTWPSREETVRAATTVVFTTIFVATLIGAYDFVWKNVADLVLFSKG